MGQVCQHCQLSFSFSRGVVCLQKPHEHEREGLVLQCAVQLQHAEEAFQPCTRNDEDLSYVLPHMDQFLLDDS